MAKLQYSTTINAPQEKVWHTMLDEDTYKQWTGEFYPGSYYDGSWEKGADIKFVAADEDGKLGGIWGKVVESDPFDFVSVEYVGQIVDGQLDAESEEGRAMVGAHESYRFSENNGVTTVDVELSGDGLEGQMAEMFDDMWPNALRKLKQLCEQS